MGFRLTLVLSVTGTRTFQYKQDRPVAIHSGPLAMPHS